MSHQIKELCDIKEHLVHLAKKASDNDFSQVDTHEMGEVIDMIKDLSQAIYYDTVTHAMSDKSEDDEEFDVSKAMEDLRHIWDEADMNHRIALKSNVQRLLNDMNE